MLSWIVLFFLLTTDAPEDARLLGIRTGSGSDRVALTQGERDLTSFLLRRLFPKRYPVATAAGSDDGLDLFLQTFFPDKLLACG